jgi:diguanylate cyclase (GGDEF)-like protein
MLTAQDSKNDIIAGLDAGADEYLIKPVHKPELQARLRTALRIIELEGIREAHLEQARAVSLVDALTGIHNRKFMEERLPLEIKRANRYQRPLSIILVGFERIAEFRRGQGIFATEKLLQAAASSLDEAIRKDIDWVARWDEQRFLVLLPETAAADAAIVAKRFRIRLGQAFAELTSESMQVCGLFGISGFVGAGDKRDMTPDLLLEHAQRCLEAAGVECPINSVRLG